MTTLQTSNKMTNIGIIERDIFIQHGHNFSAQHRQKYPADDARAPFVHNVYASIKIGSQKIVSADFMKEI